MEMNIENYSSESLADLIVILQSVYNDEDGDKIWENSKDWLLDNDGNRVYL